MKVNMKFDTTCETGKLRKQDAVNQVVPNQEVEVGIAWIASCSPKSTKHCSLVNQLGNGFPIGEDKEEDSSVWKTDSSLLNHDTSL